MLTREGDESGKEAPYLLFIPWVCFHPSFNLYCSFSDWRKEQFQPGKLFFIFLAPFQPAL